jgi:hypothetical protein
VYTLSAIGAGVVVVGSTIIGVRLKRKHRKISVMKSKKPKTVKPQSDADVLKDLSNKFKNDEVE